MYVCMSVKPIVTTDLDFKIWFKIFNKIFCIRSIVIDGNKYTVTGPYAKKQNFTGVIMHKKIMHIEIKEVKISS